MGTVKTSARARGGAGGSQEPARRADGPAEKAGRPRQVRVTQALHDAGLCELAANGYAGATIAAVAARARTSKQAVYRRYRDKEALLAASLAAALADARPAPPQRGSVAEDLRRTLMTLAGAVQDTGLGRALQALGPDRSRPDIAAVLDEAEAGVRLTMRQIFIGTPFEAGMDIRIDLLLGLVQLRQARPGGIGARDIETAIHLVLGLVPPRAPNGASGASSGARAS